MMETFTYAYPALSIYSASVSIALVVLAVKVYKSNRERNLLYQQNLALEEQVVQQDQIIKEEITKTADLERVVVEQSNRLKQHENFIESLRKAQEKARSDRAEQGIPVDEIPVGAQLKDKHSGISGTQKALMRGGIMLARIVLLGTGIPPFF